MSKETFDWSSTGSTGFENVDQSDLGLPLLVLLQDGSAEVKKSHPKHEQKKVEGAAAGDILHQLTRRVIYKGGTKGGLKVIPEKFVKVYEQWHLRENGGGFVRTHTSPDILRGTSRDEKNRDILTNADGTKDEIKTTLVFYVLAQVEGDWIPGVLKWTSTQLSVGRQWVNRAMGLTVRGPKGLVNAPLFSHIWELSTFVATRNGDSFYSHRVDNPTLITDRELAERAYQVHRNLDLDPARAIGNDSEEVEKPY